MFVCVRVCVQARACVHACVSLEGIGSTTAKNLDVRPDWLPLEDVMHALEEVYFFLLLFLSLSHTVVPKELNSWMENLECTLSRSPIFAC